MAKDSMFNACAVVRRVTGKELSDYDINLNFVGGGAIDGPSAGCAITTALISALTDTPVRQDMAVTGEISVQGLVKPVGGVFEKAYGARQIRHERDYYTERKRPGYSRSSFTVRYSRSRKN